MIDLHCHLDLFPNPGKVANEAAARGMYILSVTTTPSAWSGTNRLLRDYKKIKPALGLHPEIAHERLHELELFDSLLCKTDYVGEIGLDGSTRFKKTSKSQKKAFDHILRQCENAGGKILSIHSRNAAASVIDSLETRNGSGLPVLHWFSGNSTDLKRAIRIGCWFSVGPKMLSSKKGCSIIKEIPIDRIITETDSPFTREGNLPLYPWSVEQAEIQLSRLWGIPHREVRAILLTNFRNLVAFKAATYPSYSY